MCIVEKTCVLDKLRPGMTDSAIGLNSMLMKQQYMLNKMSLNRNTY